MGPVGERRARYGMMALLACGGGAVAMAPGWAPLWVALALVTTAWPLWEAWRAARGTALRGAVFWVILAVGLGIAAQIGAWDDPPSSGRVVAGYWAYLSVLATLAGLISVLNARTPGGGAWALLMALLVLVFLIPWLEAPGMARGAGGLARLRLGSPWTLFYVLLVTAGVTNYIPTRYGAAAAWLALGFTLEYVALTRDWWTRATRSLAWSAVPWTLAVAIWTARWRSRRVVVPQGGSGLEATWIWFRDHWGVVWALRVQERFNRTAEVMKWPVRLGWHGVVPALGIAPGAVPGVPDGAEATLRGLLRRFADPARIGEAVDRVRARP